MCIGMAPSDASLLHFPISMNTFSPKKILLDSEYSCSVFLGGIVVEWIDELNKQWAEKDTVFVTKSERTGEDVYFYCDGTIVPEHMKNHLLARSLDSSFTYEEFIDEFQRLVKKMSDLMRCISEGDYWELNESEMPSTISFEFKYPNGKQGDVDYFLASEYGQVDKIGSTEYKVTISTEHKDQIALMLNWYHPSFQMDELIERKEVINFLNIYHRCHILRMLCDVFVFRPYKDEFRGFPAVFQYYPLRNMGRDIAAKYMEKVRKERSELYSFLVAQKKTTGRWVSEQKLYAIVKDLYKDAIYQYNADWLGLQSIDIFIPSKRIAIEYQGVQHYEPITIFGGEQGLSDTRKRDESKRKKCAANNICLLEWKYDLPVTKENAIKMIDNH